MFRRKEHNLPKDPSYPSDLNQLGIMLNEKGQFIKHTSPSSFFEYHVTDNERANEVHREAVHELVRQIIIEELDENGIKPIYLSGTICSMRKPEGPHVTILTTDLWSLKKKQDVIVVVNEHMQDLGIWAYRSLMREGGIVGGSAVGLMKKLRGWAGRTPRQDPLTSTEDATSKNVVQELQRPTPPICPNLAEVTAKLKLDHIYAPDFNNMESATKALRNMHQQFVAASDDQEWQEDLAERDTEKTLLLESHKEIEGRPDGYRAVPELDCQEESVPGLIILNPGQLLYSHQLNKCMSQSTWLARPKENALADNIRIDETHNRVLGHRNAEEHTKTVLEHVVPRLTRPDVRLYIVGLSEGGEYVLKHIDRMLSADPNAAISGQLKAIVLMQPTHNLTDLHSPAFASFLLSKCKSYILSDHPKGVVAFPRALQQPIHYSDNIPSTSAVTPATGSNRKREDSDSAMSEPIAIPRVKPRELNTDYEEPLLGSSNSFQSATSLDMSTASLPHSPSELEQSVTSLKTVASSVEKSQSTISKSVDLEKLAISDANLETDPYADADVSCVTFSSGTAEYTELIWPSVMEDVLEWFRSLQQEALQREGISTNESGNKGGAGSA